MWKMVPFTVTPPDVVLATTFSLTLESSANTYSAKWVLTAVDEAERFIN